VRVCVCEYNALILHIDLLLLVCNAVADCCVLVVSVHPLHPRQKKTEEFKKVQRREKRNRRKKN
jgi:hypothetical protein